MWIDKAVQVHRSPVIDCYYMRAVPNLNPSLQPLLAQIPASLIPKHIPPKSEAQGLG